MISTGSVDIDVFRRYAGLSLPRHVSYPMPTWWHDLDSADAASMYRRSNLQEPGYDLSLYVHIPFCETLCKFCACNRVIQRHDATGAAERTERYVSALEHEIRHLAASLVDAPRPLRQVHYGGGSPTYLSEGQMERIQSTIRNRFTLAEDAEIAIEIDPRTVSVEHLRLLKQMGFNRVSMGVQDFDERVQRHVRRVQPFEMVREVTEACRELEFASINFDLIYGLPYQTPHTVRTTVDLTVSLAPDRVAYYHYAQIPERIATQRGMDYTRLPDSEAKLAMFLIGLERFQAAGYEFIGLDHFAKPDESLSRACHEGTIQRNFQGMTTGGGLRLLGVGASSISHLLDVGFLQNVKDTDGYIESIEEGNGAVSRGTCFSFDDRVRQAVINQLYCAARIQPEAIEERFAIRFAEYFAREMRVMEALQGDGLVQMDDTGAVIVCSPLGRVLMRNVAAVFDAYLDPEAYRRGEQACFSANA